MGGRDRSNWRPEMRHFNVRIVGCRRMGRRRHAEAIDRSKRFRLVAVTDSAQVRRWHVDWQTEFGVAAEDDVDALLARDDIEVVAVCSPIGHAR